MLQISYSHNTPHTNTNTSSLCHAVIQLRPVENFKLVSNSEYQTRLFECTVDIILSFFLYFLPIYHILYLLSTQKPNGDGTCHAMSVTLLPMICAMSRVCTFVPSPIFYHHMARTGPALSAPDILEITLFSFLHSDPVN